jgi:hypothetical protein
VSVGRLPVQHHLVDLLQEADERDGGAREKVQRALSCRSTRAVNCFYFFNEINWKTFDFFIVLHTGYVRDDVTYAIEINN